MATILQRYRTRHGAGYADVGVGEPLILIHGLGLRLESWLPQIEALSSDYRVIAVDIPGHGYSDGLAQDALLPDFVSWLGVVIDDLALEEVNIAGHSMGALIAGGAAASFGARVRRVALLNAVNRRDRTARTAVIERGKTLRAGYVDIESPLRRWFGPEGKDSQPWRTTHQWLSVVDFEGYVTAYDAFARGDDIYADAWSRVTGPALFATGDLDVNSTPAMAEEMAEATPYGRANIVHGHGHMMHLTAPDAVNRLLAEWMVSEKAPPSPRGNHAISPAPSCF